MREKDFPLLIKKLAIKRANLRCERCWSVKDLEFHHVTPLKLDGQSTLDNCIVLCHNCHKMAPQDHFLFTNLFLKFASVKEFIKHYNAENEEEALKRFCKEVDMDFKEIKRRIVSNPHSHVKAIKHGMRLSLKSRGHAGFNIPFGYDYNNGILKINLGEAKIVKDIYFWYLSGKSMGKIAKMLNNGKIPTKKGAFWAKKTISTILKNPLYCGYHRWAGIISRGNHNKIVDLETFKQAQNVIGQQGGTPTYLDFD